jgi:phosphate butyryltransferase
VAEQIKSFHRLLSRIKDLVKEKHIIKSALIGADDDRCLRAVLRAGKEGLIEPMLIGNQSNIQEVAGENGLDIGVLPIVNSVGTADSVDAAMKLVTEKKIDLLIKGNIDTRLMLTRLFDKTIGFRNGKNRVSHVAIFEHEKYPKLLLMSDAAVNVAPDIKGKLAIIQNAVGVANLLGVEMPKVAMLAAVEVIYPGMRVTEEGAVISKMADKGQIKNCLIDGPLSMDVATVPDVARQKGVTSQVAGQADILIAPNIETGNGIYKAMSMFVKARTAGIIVGGKIPVAISSRCDSVDNMFLSLVLGSYIASVDL